MIIKCVVDNLKLGAILRLPATFRDLITIEDLEENYRTLYLFESPLHVGQSLEFITVYCVSVTTLTRGE